MDPLSAKFGKLVITSLNAIIGVCIVRVVILSTENRIK